MHDMCSIPYHTSRVANTIECVPNNIQQYIYIYIYVCEYEYEYEHGYACECEYERECDYGCEGCVVSKFGLTYLDIGLMVAD